MSSPFTLREMLPSDGPALARLMENDPPAPGMSTTTCFRVDAWQAWTALKPDMAGVVAETSSFDGLAGAATVSFSDVQFNGRVMPGAYLENLKVDHGFRGQGLGTQLARWRVEKALERIGDGVIYTGTSSDNTASLATMKKWAKQLIGPFQLAINAPRRRVPRPLPGVTIRAAKPDDLAAIAAQSNRFYADYNLYAPLSAERLSAMLATKPAVYHYRVAVDDRGNRLAGALLTERSQLMVDEFRNVPTPLRLMNTVIHFIPPDYQMRVLEANMIWFDQLAAAQQLWEMIRWEFRDRVNTLSSAYDQRSPVREVYRPNPRYIPKITLMFVVSGPAEMDTSRLFCHPVRG